MKIRFLGTSHGVPGADRHCQSIVIEAGGSVYLIDAGAPVTDLMLHYGYDLNSLRAVFITHCHGDHLNGLIHLADLAGWYFKEMDFDMFIPEKSVGDAMLNYIEAISPDYVANSERLRIRTQAVGLVYEDENIKVTAYPTDHMIYFSRPAYGYLVEADGKRVYISGDLNHNLIDYPQLTNTEELDAFIVECAHFPAEQLVENLMSTKAKKVLITHVFPLEKYEVFESFRSKAHFELMLPCDGDSFEI